MSMNDESWNDLVKSIESEKPFDANQLYMIKHFGLLRDELKREYFWCKVKLNTYAVILLGLILFFELGY